VTEHVDTPSGPRGRRARWHETLSQFDLEIKYIPGPDNVVPDALSRWAYPASSAREDVSFHGSEAAKQEVREMIQRELELSRQVSLIRLKSQTAGTVVVGGRLPPDSAIAARVCVLSAADREATPAGVVGKGDEKHGTWLRSSRRRWQEKRPTSPGSEESEEEPPLSSAMAPMSPPASTPPVSPFSQTGAGGTRHGKGGGDRAEPAAESLEFYKLRSDCVCPPSALEENGEGDEDDGNGDWGDGDGDGPDWEEWTKEWDPCANPWEYPPENWDSVPGEVEGPPDPGPQGLEGPVSCPALPHVDLGFRFATPGRQAPSAARPSKRLPIVPPPSKDAGRERDSGSQEGAELSPPPGDPDQQCPVQTETEPVGQTPPTPVGVGFRFADPPPGSRPGGVSRLPPIRMSRGPTARLVEDPGATQAMRAPSHIMDEDWSGDYECCPFFAEPWMLTTNGEIDWPREYQVYNGKMYYQERLCIPTGLVYEVLRIHHEWVGHVGNDRLLPEVLRRYCIPPSLRVERMIQDIRRKCLVCQACDKPNFSRRRPLAMTPIPDRFMSSVCLDVFFMPCEEWQGQTFDAFLLCVDRHSGWMIARPTQNAGLTGEKACHLMLDSAWGEVGVPSVVTTDLGAQFVSSWWHALCSRLGIRVAFAHAHRHQGNGRAEVAGRVIQDILRKLCLDSDMNWVEALPRALRVQHDMVDPVTNLSPYEIIFGRERSLAGLPWEPRLRCPEANAFFDRMDEIDRQVAELLNEEHAKLAGRLNADRAEGTPFQVGDWVWYLRPKSVGGAKLQTYWQGPFKVLTRLGERSYRLRTPEGQEFDCHQDQLKACVGGGPGPLLTLLQHPPSSSPTQGRGCAPDRGLVSGDEVAME